MERRTKYAIALILALTAIIVGLTVYSRTDREQTPAIRLEAITDSDGDGIPDWQEEILETSPHDPSSFPYDRNRAFIENISVEEVLYPGPGSFTEEILNRIITGTKLEEITDEEQGRLIAEVVAYFEKSVEERGLPDTSLQVDDTLERQQVLRDYVAGLKAFGETRPITPLIYELLEETPGIEADVRNAIVACDRTLKTLPRKVPSDIVDTYRLVYERIVYVCEALEVARSTVTAEDYFYITKLLIAGELFDGVEVLEITALDEIFLNALTSTFTRLQNTVSG